MLMWLAAGFIGSTLAVEVAPLEPERPRLKGGAASASSAPAQQKVRSMKTLPHANGRTFATLDAYLAYLRDHAAPMDLPWYREVRPGIFRRESNLRNGITPPEFTRTELEQRFGFAR